MFLADYHLHTKNSMDGCETVETVCDRAIAMGLTEIALTDHLDFTTKGAYDAEINTEAQHADMRRAITKYEGRLRVRRGAEIGQPQSNPSQYRAYMQRYEHDFLIGSIHNLKQDADIYFFDYSTLDCNKLMQDYLAELMELASDYDFDVMGHVTYPMRYMHQHTGKTLDMALFEGDFRTLFRLLADKGRGIEVNTSGLRQSIGTTLPPLQLVKWYRECGGTYITVGSDAHRAPDVGAGIKEGYALLKEAGFRYVTTYENRKPKQISLE